MNSDSFQLNSIQLKTLYFEGTMYTELNATIYVIILVTLLKRAHLPIRHSVLAQYWADTGQHWPNIEPARNV